jgi:hypothetical protein
MCSKSKPILVIPAKAGIHHLPMKIGPQVMAPRLRGGDEVWSKAGQ